MDRYDLALQKSPNRSNRDLSRMDGLSSIYDKIQHVNIKNTCLASAPTHNDSFNNNRALSVDGKRCVYVMCHAL